MKLPITQEVTTTKAQAAEVTLQARKLVIDSNHQFQQAGDILKRLVAAKKQLKASKDNFTKPARDIIKQANELYNDLIKDVESGEKFLKVGMLEWSNKVEVEQARIASLLEGRVERGTMKLETAVRKASELPTVDTAGAGVSKSIIKKVKITNPELVPSEYWFIDEAAVRRDALGNKAQGIAPIYIPGVEVYEEAVLGMR